MTKVRFRAFLTFGAFLFVAFILAAGMRVAFATAPSPNSGLTTTHTGYDVGVEITVNGETHTVSAGDVVATGIAVEIDKTPLWDILESVAHTLETAALIALVNEVSALPDGHCDFGDIELGVSLPETHGENRTERFRFAPNEDCGLEFRGKEVVEVEYSDSSNDISSLFGISSTHASSRSTGRHGTSSGCLRDRGDSTETGNSLRERHLSGEDRLATDSNVARLGIEVRARLRVVDRQHLLRSDGRPVFEEDCTAALTTVDAQFGYSQSGAPALVEDSGLCSYWQNRVIGIPVVRFWLQDVDPATGRHCSRKNVVADAGTVGIGTVGFYKIDPSSQLTTLLDGLDVPFTKYNTEQVSITAEAYFAPMPVESGRESPQASFSCRANKMPYIRTTGRTGPRYIGDIRRVLGLLGQIPATIIVIPRTFTTYLECTADYYTIRTNGSQDDSPRGPIAPPPPRP